MELFDNQTKPNQTKLKKTQAYFSRWFSGRESIRSLPADCVADCTGSGPADDAVEYWVKRLNFDAPAWYLRDYLEGFGAYDSAELCDHQANLKRLLWLWASDCMEGSFDMYLGS